MSAPDSTVASLDDYRTDAGSLLRRLHAHADRLKLMVDVTFAPVSQRHWVTAYDPNNPNADRDLVHLDRDTVEAAMTAALEEMETL